LRTIVVKIGGRLLHSITATEINVGKTAEYAEVLRGLSDDGYRLAVVTGGGDAARLYIGAARRLGASEALCDQIGIWTTRMNAYLLITALGSKAHPVVPRTVYELVGALESGKVVVMGGIQPGQSTDAVAAIASELSGAQLMIKATDVDGIYTADPKKDPNAERIPEITHGELLKLILDAGLQAGEYAPLDPVALKILARSRIPIRVVDGRNPENVRKAATGEPIGTLVKPEEKRET